MTNSKGFRAHISFGKGSQELACEDIKCQRSLRRKVCKPSRVLLHKWLNNRPVRLKRAHIDDGPTSKFSSCGRAIIQSLTMLRKVR